MPSPTVVKPDSTLLLDYELSTEEEVLDSTFELKPLTVRMGQGDVHPFIERILLGRANDESFECRLDPSVAFGDIDDTLIIVLSKKQMPVTEEPYEVGSTFQSKDPKGKMRRFRVTQIEGNRVTLDGNHPFAGQVLELRGKIIQIFA